MKKLIKEALILFVITIVAGFLLGLVYETTKDARTRQEEKAQKRAYQEVFKDAESFKNVMYDADAVDKFILDSDEDIQSGDIIIDGIVSAQNSDGEIMGYVVTVTDTNGYGGDIQFTVGIQNDGTVNGISILSISETAGLGMKAQDDSFKNQYSGKNVDKFEYTKDGASNDNEIDAISGATITTKAMTNGTNAAIYCVDYLTGGGSNE
ncbi:MAG: RnfABCDGE type electron transport complex subunit G [Eubacterium sp.]